MVHALLFNRRSTLLNEVKKSIMMIVGACIFLIAAAQSLPLFFGL